MSAADRLFQAKQRLPLPKLMAQCGHRDQAKKSARCMFHEDSSNSFSVYQHEDGYWAWKCHAGCGGGDEPDWLGKLRNLSNGDACREFIKLSGVADAPVPTRSGPGSIVAIYDYRDESGTMLYQAVRYEPKTFRQRRPDAAASDGWARNLDGVRRVLYRLPEIIAAVERGELIILVEGEKDVAALVTLGFNATCNAGGAGKWLDDYTDTLRGAAVVIVADKDTAGRNHARFVARKLHGAAESVRVVELPDFKGRPVKDAHDFFAAGASADDFRAVVDAAPPFHPDTGPDLQANAPARSPNPRIRLPENADDDGAPEPFPVDCLPPVMAELVRGVATAQGVPESLPGLMALAVVAASIGKGLSLNWRPGKASTPANLYVIASAESGSGKSECARLVTGAFLTFERTVQEEWHKDVFPGLQAKLRIAEGQLKKLDRKITKESTTTADFEHYQGEMAFHLAQVEELKRQMHAPQLSIQDATVEKVATVLHSNDETIFSTSADARKLCDNLLGRYSANKKLADDGIYLAAFSGDDVKVDRQGREGVRLANPCLTLLWALQPDALEMLLDEDSLQQGGFLARCLLAHTHAEPQHIGGEARPLSDEVRSRWDSFIQDLLTVCRLLKSPDTGTSIDIS